MSDRQLAALVEEQEREMQMTSELLAAQEARLQETQDLIRQLIVSTRARLAELPPEKRAEAERNLEAAVAEWQAAFAGDDGRPVRASKRQKKPIP